MLTAAFTSALATKPHKLHSNRDWLLRFALSQCPHFEQVRDVLRGSTKTQGMPASCALYVILARRSAKDQPPKSHLISRPKPLLRSRIFFKSSSASAFAVLTALATICLEITWFAFFRYRLSFLPTRFR